MDVISFTKMHGIGNDYIYIDCTKTCPDRLPELSREMSPRHTSVGADGIILILRSEIADFKMRIFNADGSEAKMCGNGSRCVGKYVYDHKLTTKTSLTLETLSGVKSLFLKVNKVSGKVEEVTVDMGSPILECQEIPVMHSADRMISAHVETSVGEMEMTAVSMGNPHGVVFMNRNVDNLEIESIGRELECHPMWPDRANIEFINITGPDRIKMRVWERGSGETMACGTGACAAAVAYMLKMYGHAEGEVDVELRGGNLHIAIDDRGHVMMTGPATEVFNGTYRRLS